MCIRDRIYGVLMAAMMVPIYALIVPLFIQEKKIGILNSRWSLIPVYVAMELPMSVFLIDSYMQGISIDMEAVSYTHLDVVPASACCGIILGSGLTFYCRHQADMCRRKNVFRTVLDHRSD